MLFSALWVLCGNADGGPDFSSMIAGVALRCVAAIVAMGVVKIAPNFAKWATNKVAASSNHSAGCPEGSQWEPFFYSSISWVES
ncbi:hypothetical protein QNM99_17050 [Pseudomonas sp. PCH446]